jgi:indole-3-glycerol phosphate synthase
VNILNTIIEHKRQEVAARKRIIPADSLEKSALFSTARPSFYEAIAEEGPSVIAEFKRRSPSKGIINDLADVDAVARGYESAGVSAMSILTDLEFFGGDELDLCKVAAFSAMPLLRKDFIIDEYQVIEAKSFGASAILLIAGVLSKKEIYNFTDLAGSMDMDVLCEVHEATELKKLGNNIRIVGINNRNLKTFGVDLGHSRDLMKQLPADCLKVAESGLSSIDEVILLHKAGFDAFLIGENFMRNTDPGRAAEKFIKGLKQEGKR